MMTTLIKSGVNKNTKVVKVFENKLLILITNFVTEVLKNCQFIFPIIGLDRQINILITTSNTKMYILTLVPCK